MLRKACAEPGHVELSKATCCTCWISLVSTGSCVFGWELTLWLQGFCCSRYLRTQYSRRGARLLNLSLLLVHATLCPAALCVRGATLCKGRQLQGVMTKQMGHTGMGLVTTAALQRLPVPR